DKIFDDIRNGASPAVFKQDLALVSNDSVLLKDIPNLNGNQDQQIQAIVDRFVLDPDVQSKLTTTYQMEFGEGASLSSKLALDTTPQQVVNDVLHASDADLLALKSAPKSTQDALLRSLTDAQKQVVLQIVDGTTAKYEGSMLVFDTYDRDAGGALKLQPADEIRLCVVGGGNGLQEISDVLSSCKTAADREAIVNAYAQKYGHELKYDVMQMVGDNAGEQVKYAQLIDAVTISDAREYVLKVLEQYFKVDSGLAANMLQDTTRLGAIGGVNDLAATVLNEMDPQKVQEIFQQTMTMMDQMSNSKKSFTDNVDIVATTVAGLILAALPGGQALAAESLGQAAMILARAFVVGAVMKVGIKGGLLGQEYNFNKSGAEDISMGGMGGLLMVVGPQIF
ncbi:MAG: hypothetical protein ACRD3W_29405, partial [Terriglobales bacterium]